MKKHIPALEQKTQQVLGRGLRARYELGDDLPFRMVELLDQLRERDLGRQGMAAVPKAK